MVKNITGGNKHKGQARKNVNGNQYASASKVRVATNEFEIYAQVTKFWGGKRFDALDIHGKTRMCTIPQKFSGRNAKDNRITVNTWVLIGERQWQVSETPVYDLLEVYSEYEKHYLKKNIHANWNIFESSEKSSGSDMIEFGNEHSEYQDIITREAQAQVKLSSVEVEEEAWINVDDI
jgi:translation initiation factor IF-1